MTVTRAFMSENTLVPEAPEQTEVNTEVPYTPDRVLMQDFTGAPCVVDFLAINDVIAEPEGDPPPRQVNTRVEIEDSARDLALTLRIDTPGGKAHFVHGGIRPHVLHQLIVN